VCSDLQWLLYDTPAPRAGVRGMYPTPEGESGLIPAPSIGLRNENSATAQKAQSTPRTRGLSEGTGFRGAGPRKIARRRDPHGIVEGSRFIRHRLHKSRYCQRGRPCAGTPGRSAHDVSLRGRTALFSHSPSSVTLRETLLHGDTRVSTVRNERTPEFPRRVRRRGCTRRPASRTL